MHPYLSLPSIETLRSKWLCSHVQPFLLWRDLGKARGHTAIFTPCIHGDLTKVGVM